ncbi:MAG: toll/interleukin-1 receptor domain-containing protein [Bacteroidota bacterium]
MDTKQKEYDVFISHATEDKKDFVRPLAETLSSLGYRVWYDEFTISVGDGLRRAIDKGISKSRFGIVVLSKAFFENGWTNYELDGLMQFDTENRDEAIILPIWYNIRREDVFSYSSSLANKIAISTDGEDIDRVVKELEKKIGEYFYSVNNQGKIVRSNQKVNIDFSKREKKFQFICNNISHRLFTKEKSVVTSDVTIYPYSKDFNTLKFNHWQSNIGQIQLVRHVAYDLENGHLISTKNEIIKNDGNNFVSAVEFNRPSSGPVRVVCEIKTTNLFKSIFQEGSDEFEVYHRLPIEHYSFSLFLPHHEDFSKIECYINGEIVDFSIAPGGRQIHHEIFGTELSKTIYSFVNEEKKQF